MSPQHKDGFSYQVPEWWDRDGHHHNSPPTADELIGEAVQVTVHLTDEQGLDAYYTAFSNIGWTDGDLEADAEDAYHSGAYE